MKEGPIEQYLREKVKKYGGECIKLESPPKGIHDRLVILPGGFIAFVECKRPVCGVLANLQRFWATRILELGQRSYLVETRQAVDELIREWQYARAKNEQ